jgi:glycosyltransferase involved in cell wall biosynthesis
VAANVPFRVIGYLSARLGLAVSARNTLATLESRGELFTAVDVDLLDGRSHLENDFPVGMARPGRGVNLFHMNPLEVVPFEDQWRRSPVNVNASLNAIVPFWELPVVPEAWTPIIRSMDLVLAPTQFVRDAVSSAVSTPVLDFPQAVFLPDDISPDRERFGLPAGTTVFLVTFDPGSDHERKNPLAAVEAFIRAFGDSEDVLLLLKTPPHNYGETMRVRLDDYMSQVPKQSNIRVMNESMSYRDVLTLYASCDVLVSLHRSEGLGLHLMEAMSLGKPVIATGWSGNTDFMTPENSLLVDYELVPIASTFPVYARESGRPGQVWAEPIVGQAAEVMRSLHESPELRTRIGSLAAAHMQKRRKLVLAGEVFDQVTELASQGAYRRRKERGEFTRLVSSQRRSTAVPRLKRKVVLSLRRAGLYPAGD